MDKIIYSDNYIVQRTLVSFAHVIHFTFYFLFQLYDYILTASFFFSGSDTDCSRMCGFLLHVEKVRTVWLLCSTEPFRQEEVQLLPGCDVSTGMRNWCLCLLSNVCFKENICWLCPQRPDGQAGGWGGGSGGGQFVIRVFSRIRGKDGGVGRATAWTAQLHHRQWPHRWAQL